MVYDKSVYTLFVVSTQMTSQRFAKGGRTPSHNKTVCLTVDQTQTCSWLQVDVYSYSDLILWLNYHQLACTEALI